MPADMHFLPEKSLILSAIIALAGGNRKLDLECSSTDSILILRGTS
jgi:hypothetical protein